MVLPHARLAPSGIPRNFGPNDSKFPRRVESCFLERPSLKVASTSSKSNRVHFRYCEGFRTWRDVEFESVTSSKADAYKALQFKLIFFVPVDGWSLAAGRPGAQGLRRPQRSDVLNVGRVFALQVF
jgi:hypothetical protein